MALRILSSLALFAAVGGCTSHLDGPIDYRTGGGLSGNGDGTALHVEPDGTATRTNAGGGMETATLDFATMNDLRQKIGDAQFPTLAPEYLCDCPDEFSFLVSAQIDGNVYTVLAEGREKYPEPLKVLIVTLGEIEQRPLGWH